MRMQCMTGSPAGGVVRPLLAGAAMLSFFFLLTGAGAALAHDGVVATSPAAGARLPAAPSAVELQLSSPPQSLGTEVRVTGQDGSVVSEGAAEVLGSTVREALAAGLAGGAYAVEWRVTSGDGDPISGSFDFTVAEAAAAPSPVTSDAAAPPAGPSTGVDMGEASAAAPAGSSSSTALVVGGALVVLLLAGLVARRLRRQA